jgi:hypothetical protein
MSLNPSDQSQDVRLLGREKAASEAIERSNMRDRLMRNAFVLPVF